MATPDYVDALTPIDPTTYGSGADEEVSDQFTFARDYASEAYNNTKTFMSDVEDTLSELNRPDTSGIEYPEQEVSLESDATRPADITEEFGLVTGPDAPELLETVLGAFMDTPDATASAPTLTDPTEPDGTMPDDPGDAPEMRDADEPDAPEWAWPDEPVLEDIAFPELSPLNEYTFSGTSPDDLDYAPEVSFEFNEESYVARRVSEMTALNTAVETKLLDEVSNGGTGLGSDVEAAIWQRAQDRSQDVSEKAYTEAETYFTARGFTIPTGAMGGRLLEILAEQNRALAQLNYEIMIEQARLAQSNTQFVIQQAMGMEAMMQGHHHNLMNRALDVEKSTVTLAVEAYNAEIARFNAQAQMYQTEAQVYDIKLRGELTKLERYKAEIEASKAHKDIQMMDVELYKAKLSGIQQKTEIYKSQIQAAQLNMETDRLKLEAFKAHIDVYQAKIEARKAEFGLYQAKIDGNKAKVMVYAEQVRADQTSAEIARIDAEKKKIQADVTASQNASLIEHFKAEVDKYRASITYEETKFGAVLKDYEQRGKIYDTDTRYEAAKLQAQIDEFKGKIQQATNQTELKIKEAELEIQSYLGEINIRLEVLKSGANMAAQISSSSLSTINANAGWTYSTGLTRHDSVSVGTNLGNSLQESHQYNHTTV